MVKIFFSDVAKKLGENVAEKCGEVIEKKLAEKKLVKKYHFSSTTTDQIFNQMKNAVGNAAMR